MGVREKGDKSSYTTCIPSDSRQGHAPLKLVAGTEMVAA